MHTFFKMHFPSVSAHFHSQAKWIVSLRLIRDNQEKSENSRQTRGTTWKKGFFWIRAFQVAKKK